MAKCVESSKSKEVRRVSDEEARKLVNNGWQYVSKSAWKQATRQPEEV